MPAKGSAEWKGDVPTGTGTFTAGDTISGGYTFKSRFEDGPGSNPEQLIAAAHAACFSMALSNILAQAGSPPESVRTDATVTLRPVDGSPHHHQNRPGHGGHGARDRRGRLQGTCRGGKGRVPGQPRPGRRARNHPRGVAGLTGHGGPATPASPARAGGGRVSCRAPGVPGPGPAGSAPCRPGLRGGGPTLRRGLPLRRRTPGGRRCRPARPCSFKGCPGMAARRRVTQRPPSLSSRRRKLWSRFASMRARMDRGPTGAR